MRAWRVHELGEPEAVLHLDEIDAAIAGPGEVVVDVAAGSLNFPDVLMCRGEYQVKPPLPFTPGAEVSGVVTVLGDGVDAGVPPEFGWQVAGAHVVARDRAGTRLLVAYGDEGERLRNDPRYRVLVATDELPPARRAELRRLQASYTGIREQIRWSRSHPVLARRMAELAAHSARAVVLVERT